ncbi:hypothetical protein ACF06X_07395 [Streptomyces sp. NPDC015346]|uniref:hypothetical protein n=1 Tax=Streptomyces sp. NPDC015346 TaxID=3364954 RepID=UPI003700F6AD
MEEVAGVGDLRVRAESRLAALLPAFPPTGPRPMLAMAAGFCVEHGADPADCAEPILGGVHQDLLDALEFARRWASTCAAEGTAGFVHENGFWLDFCETGPRRFCSGLPKTSGLGDVWHCEPKDHVARPSPQKLSQNPRMGS